MAGKSINELTEITNVNDSGLMALSSDGSTLGRVGVSTLQNAFIGQHVTNYIKSIPQDVNLTLNSSGVLTLKAGSKLYVPNGFEEDGTTPKFDTVIMQNDALNDTTGNGSMLMCLCCDGNYFFAGFEEGSSTVTSRPSSPVNYALYYNTTTNKIEFYDGSSWISDCSLPVALASRNTSGFTSINQVFNGFGYVGSTIFALPGIVAEMPNGKESNGVLKNTEFTTTEVKTYTFSSLSDFGYSIYLTPLGLNYVLSTNYSESFTVPTNKTGYALWLDKNTNLFYAKDFDVVDSSWTQVQLIGNVCKFNTISGIISNFTSKEPLTLLDSNTLDTIPHIIETWTDGTSWYRVWSDGWCEQGGHFSVIASAALYTVTMFKPYLDTNYNLQITLASTYSTLYTDGASPRYDSACNKTTISFIS